MYLIPGKPPIVLTRYREWYEAKPSSFCVCHSKWLELWFDNEDDAEKAAAVYARIERVAVETLDAGAPEF